MERQASLDLLNATHDFPCAFTVKVIGANQDQFVERCVAAVQQVVPDGGDVPFSTRATSNGRHTSVTLHPTLDSAEHVLIVYESLRVVEGVVMTM